MHRFKYLKFLFFTLNLKILFKSKNWFLTTNYVIALLQKFCLEVFIKIIFSPTISFPQIWPESEYKKDLNYTMCDWFIRSQYLIHLRNGDTFLSTLLLYFQCLHIGHYYYFNRGLQVGLWNLVFILFLKRCKLLVFNY